MPLSNFLFIVIVAALFIASVIYSRKRQQERQLALLRLAAKHGWTFDPSNDSTHDARFSHFSIFTNGHTRYAYNTTRGSVVIAGDDWPLQYGDFHYQTTSSNGKTTTTRTHLLSYVILDSPYATAPDLFIRKERFFDRIASAIGFEDIDFESVEFSRDFHVKSSDKRFAYDVISPQVMEFMLSTTPPTVDFRGSQCCLYHDGILEVEDLAATIQWTTEFFEHWPRHVIADLAARRQAAT